MLVDYYDIFTRKDITVEIFPAAYRAFIEVDRRTIEYDYDGRGIDGDDVVEQITRKIEQQHNINCRNWIDDTGCGPGPRCIIVTGLTVEEVQKGIKLLERELNSNAGLVMKAFLENGISNQTEL